ncbi:hypothetical protein GLIP_2921 [Aliiglaciecola lipolytica E3]|uniref:Uncharacterized protein n=1 Tax=Aliiglaciecola lipolytica E3 TaxID=1127673 RepID=K6YBH4_9ALTE|nr:hypothetical protein GLIP_2921 [Aliiglaciecola lipolytica E3]
MIKQDTNKTGRPNKIIGITRLAPALSDISEFSGSNNK